MESEMKQLRPNLIPDAEEESEATRPEIEGESPKIVGIKNEPSASPLSDFCSSLSSKERSSTSYFNACIQECLGSFDFSHFSKDTESRIEEEISEFRSGNNTFPEFNDGDQVSFAGMKFHYLDLRTCHMHICHDKDAMQREKLHSSRIASGTASTILAQRITSSSTAKALQHSLGILVDPIEADVIDSIF